MNVRCLGCQTEVSEWAAHCPVCGRSLADAEPLVEPEPVEAEAPAPVAPPVTRMDEEDEEDDDADYQPMLASPSRPGVGKVAFAVVAAAVLLGAGFGIGLSQRGHHHVTSGPPVKASSRSASQALPADLAGERLFFAEQGRTGLYQANGQQLSTMGSFGDGYPLEPLVSGLGIAVYIHDGHAYRTSVGATAPATELGPATAIFPGRNGTIGIQDSATVRYMAADGDYPIGKITVVPADDTAVAQVPLGLVVAQGAELSGIDEEDHLRITLLMPVKRTPLEKQDASDAPVGTELLGSATWFIGAHGSTLAWVSCPGDVTVNCSLDLVDTTNLYTRVVRAPLDSSGFAQGGAFSPDGAQLAVFVRSPLTLTNSGTVVRLAVYDVATGRLTTVGPALTAQQPGGLATWSIDGQYLYFGGLLGNLYAEPVTAIDTAVPPIQLPLKTSFSVVGY
jgi:hypothetical protein